MMENQKEVFYLSGNNLDLSILEKLSRKEFWLDIHENCWERIERSRHIIDDLVERNIKAYGVTTGFGYFSDKLISSQQTLALQKNIIRSHSCGVGSPLPPPLVRILLVLRINTIIQGYSGFSKESLKTFINAFNFDIIPYIPLQGTVGASGDLAPLSHLGLGLIGEGLLYDEGIYKEASEVMEKKKFKKLELKAKEGLSLINGTQFLTTFAIMSYLRVENLLKTFDLIYCLSFELLGGTMDIIDDRLFKGDKVGEVVIKRLRNYIIGDNSLEKRPRRQVPMSFSISTFPQTQSSLYSTLSFAHKIIMEEVNAVTDNPLVFKKEDDPDLKEDSIISGGNFHGEYIAKIGDFIGMVGHQAGMMSERRIERFVNPKIGHFDGFLTKNGGLNSGFMIAQYAAASLVSENKHLSMSASVDSIPTSAEQEDHVSMGGWATRKSLQIVENSERIAAIELMSACQALDLVRSLQLSPKLEKLHAFVRKIVPYFEEDNVLSPYFEKLAEQIKNGNLLQNVD